MMETKVISGHSFAALLKVVNFMSQTSNSIGLLIVYIGWVISEKRIATKKQNSLKKYLLQWIDFTEIYCAGLPIKGKPGGPWPPAFLKLCFARYDFLEIHFCVIHCIQNFFGPGTPRISSGPCCSLLAFLFCLVLGVYIKIATPCHFLFNIEIIHNR